MTNKKHFVVSYPEKDKHNFPNWEGKTVQILRYCPPESWADPGALVAITHFPHAGAQTWIRKEYLVDACQQEAKR